MDFELPEELRILKATLRRFVDNELIPIERETTNGEQLKPEYLERFERRANELGIWQLDVPTEYGGGGMSILARAVVWEELSRTIAIPARGEGITGPSARGILYSLQGEMKEKYLLPLLRGEKKACFAQTEPDAGSDPGSMRPPPCATAIITSSTASSALSLAPAMPISCSSWSRPTAQRARAAVFPASSWTWMRRV